MNAVAYLRVSTDKQAETGLSLDAQRSHIERWCLDQGITLEAVCVDAGLSGSASVADRPGLMEALSYGSSIVVAKLDRLSRSPFILLALEQELSKKGLRILSVAGEGTSDDDPASILMRRMLQAVAEHELAMIRLRTKTALAQKKRRGESMGRAPFGHTYVDGVLVENEHYQTFLRVVELRNEGLTYRQIAADILLVDPHSGMNHTKARRIYKRWEQSQAA